MKHIKMGLVALALVSAPLAVTAVFAQSNGTTNTTQRMDYHQVFLQKLAGSLGVDQGKLESAMKSAADATIDAAVANKQISPRLADAMKARVQAGNYNFFSSSSRTVGQRSSSRSITGRTVTSHMRVSVLGGATLTDATAKALGISSDELRTQLKSGKTVTEIATAQKVDPKTVHQAVLEAYKTQLEAAVKAGRLPQTRADELLKAVQANPNFGLILGRGRSKPQSR